MRDARTGFTLPLVKICLDSNPAALEAASLFAAQQTIDAHHELGAPEPTECALARLIESSTAHETDIAPVLARALGEQMRQHSFDIRQRAVQRHCGRGQHLLVEENLTPDGRCRACRNEAQRNRRKVA